MSNLITAENLTKRFGKTTALNNISLNIEKGKIVGLLGRNGAGKTTLLRSIMGLSNYEGTLSVLDLVPMKQRKTMMERMSFIADVATLPRWITLNQAIELMNKTHPRFNEKSAHKFLSQTKIDLNKKVKTFSKGMIVQAHLALIMAIDSELMILDEPTLGLDILYRKTFYSNLIKDYFNDNRSVIISTHQVEEIEHILTDIIMIDEGKIILNTSMNEFHERFCQIISTESEAQELREKKPLSEKVQLGRHQFIFDKNITPNLEQYKSSEPVSLSDVFVAKMEKNHEL